MAESFHLITSRIIITASSLTTNRTQPSSLSFNNNPSLSYHNSISIVNGGRQRRRSGDVVVRAMTASFGSRLIESVNNTVFQNPVVIYSKTWCSYSLEVKSLFKRLGVEPLVIELDQLGPQGPQLQRVLERLTGQYTVPNIFIGGKHIGGCTDTVKLHHKGELKSLLSEASKQRVP
ncbi:hypothetical protein GIB67_024573 [Kingdonia uniflora]|uniref:Glutaredoxin domain-containing protein n=1 Tax=Kingdonia uniflora TaxID=39325 RepID=A0A7J7LNW1_9MAGN|nr:hypothetical protein GIB67_024573 [Kingdonia uniflora]